MSETEKDIGRIYKLIGGEFDRLDRQMGSRSKRRLAISQLPQLARDLYLVHDIVAITCNAGIGAWIEYHHNESGWLESARKAFTHIDHPQVSEDIESCHAVFLKKGDSMTHEDTDAPSSYIWNHENEIIRSLYGYLIAHGFNFLKQET